MSSQFVGRPALEHPHLPMLRMIYTCAKGASILVTVIGGLVLLGWVFDIAALKSILPIWVTMKANTAICFVLGGSALWQLANPTHRSRRYAQILSSIVLGIGLLTLIQYALGINLGIDQLLFPEPATAVATSTPGRMAVNTAFNFLLLGSALLLLSRPRSFTAGVQTFTILAFFIALLGLLGYLYGIQEFYGFGSYTKMAVHTAIAFIILSVGILCLRPDQGVMETLTSQHAGGIMSRYLFPTVLGVPPILSGLILLGYRAKLYSSEVGLSLSAVLSIVVFAVVTWINAKALGKIDGRRQWAEEQRQNEARFRSLTTATSQIVWFASADGRVVADSPSWRAYTGQPLEEYQEWGWLNAIHPDDRDKAAQRWAQAVDTQSLYEVEFRLRAADGQYRHFWVRSVPVLTEQGQVSEWIGACTDIHDRKQTNLALHQSEERLQAILDHSPAVIYMKDPQGRFITVNRQFEALFHVDKAAIVGQCNRDLFGAELAEIFDANDRQVLAAGTAMQWEEVVPQDDGLHTYLSLKFPLLAPDNSPYAICGISTDITDRKQAELALQQAKEAAEASDRAKSEFLANMSHELRTPLNGVIGYAQILQRAKTLSEEDRSRIEVIHQCGSHLLTLINDILDLSKIEARKTELLLTDFHLPAFLQGVAEMCRIRAELKGIQFWYETAPELPMGIRADEKRLRQVLTNLLSNAIKFTDTGGVTFSVSFASQGKIRFAVRDTGIGIPPDKLHLIFQPFEQVSDARRQNEGTGLGLAISQEIVGLMGSKIQVQSEMGVGSIFWFDMDLSEAAEWVKTAQADRHGQIVGIKNRRPKVLIVDDRWENRSVIAKLLNPIGFEVVEAATGQEGWQRAIVFQPDLMITDLLMPEMNGFELIKQIRASEILKDLFIIVSSASVFEDDRYRSLEAGGDDFLPKPVLAAELLQKLQKHLQLEWIYEESPATHSLIDNAELIAPPPTELEILHELTMKGSFKGLLKQASLIEQMDEKYIPFAQKLHQLARDFRDQDILALIRSCQ